MKPLRVGTRSRAEHDGATLPSRPAGWTRAKQSDPTTLTERLGRPLLRPCPSMPSTSPATLVWDMHSAAQGLVYPLQRLVERYQAGFERGLGGSHLNSRQALIGLRRVERVPGNPYRIEPRGGATPGLPEIVGIRSVVSGTFRLQLDASLTRSRRSSLPTGLSLGPPHWH